MSSAPASIVSEAPEGDNVEAPPVKLEGDALVQALKKQLEFYFSKKNLEKDIYLRSQMDASKYVAVDVIAGFNKVRSLTEDRQMLLKVMRQCKSLSVNETGKMVRPNFKVERNTIILRDIPSSTDESEIAKIFDHSDSGKVVSIRSDIGDTWFVTFESEDIAMDTCLFLSSQTFDGKPIRCRIKSETLLRGGYGAQATASVATPIPWSPGAVAAGGYYNYGAQGYGAMYPPQYGQFWNGGANSGGYKGGMGGVGVRGGRQDGGRQQGERGQRDSPRKSDSRGEKMQTKQGRQEREMPPRNDKDKDGKGGVKTGKPATQSPTNRSPKGKDVKADAGKTKKKPDAPAPALGGADFPALPTSRAPAPTVSSGYERSFAKYSIEQMAKIVRKLAGTGFSKPRIDAPTILRDTPAWDAQLLEPMPVMYPASPSPLLAAQPHHSSDMLPFLDLNMPFLPPDIPRGTAIGSESKSSKSGAKQQWKAGGKSTSSGLPEPKADARGKKERPKTVSAGKVGGKDFRKDGKLAGKEFQRNAQPRLGKGNTRQGGRKDTQESDEKVLPTPPAAMGAYAKLAAAAPSAEAVAQAKKIAMENKLRAQAKAGKDVPVEKDESGPKKTDKKVEKKDGVRDRKSGRRGDGERRRGGGEDDRRKDGPKKKDTKPSDSEVVSLGLPKGLPSPTASSGKTSYAEMARKAAERAAKRPVPPSPSRGEGRRSRESSEKR